MIVLFALCLVAIIAMAGLLIDGGMAWANRRSAQAAADAAALAAAKAVSVGSNPTTVTAAGRGIGLANGFAADFVDCDGVTHPGKGVVVNSPPKEPGPFKDKADYVEVITTKAMRTTFSGAVGVNCWVVSARAVASIAATGVASCSFCSLNNSDQNHTLVLKNGSTLRVDGDIYVNSTNGLGKDFNGTSCTAGKGDGGKENKGNFYVCGDAFDIFGAGGTITAQTISVVGGWETHDGNVVSADRLAKLPNGQPCPLHTQPLAYSTPTANVCIGMPAIADPLNDPQNPGNRIPVPPDVGKPVFGQNGCTGTSIPTGTAASPSRHTISSGSATICPGTYYGGLRISGTASVTMLPGVYVMGGGFEVLNSASVNGSSGVMIYNGSGTSLGVTTSNEGVDLVPQPPNPAKNSVKTVTLASSAKNDTVNPGANITFTFRVERATVGKNKLAVPTGTATFFDGTTPVSAACTNVPLTVSGDFGQALCTTSFPVFGSRGISAVYYGDAVYNPAGAQLTVTVTQPAGLNAGAFDITTTGSVQLRGPTSGTYKGLTIFQERSSAQTITLNPGSGGVAACPAGFMTIGVPDGTAPQPCGALGGLRGTIYAAHANALVRIQASGLANLQIIAGKIEIISDSSARFAFVQGDFANAKIRLVE
jgi:Flp pilus assembly protein TadG